MFAKSHGVSVESTQTENATVLWKEYEDSVIIIAVSILNEKRVLIDLLDTVFSAMVLSVGIDSIKNIKNIERLKRDLRVSYSTIDSIMECLDYGDRGINSSHNIFNYVETILCTEGNELQTCLDMFVERVSSMFGCVMIENCVAAATESWWDLAQMERKLLTHVLMTNTNCTIFDIPVFLPHESPTVPFRFVGVCLISSIWVGVLCGPTPDLSAVQSTAYQVWSPVLTTLKFAYQTYPRNIPHSVQIHNSVIGILLIETSIGKYLSCTNISGSKKEQKSFSEVLKTFFYQAASILVDNDDADTPSETYWCAEYHKLHALKDGNTIICSMYHSSIPTNTMRLISQQTLSLLTKDSNIHW
ncbi:protein fuzzy homolog isoform X2 [Cimex lectularius]|nr:protein fuzzy homolog isoform X2 [Cimex lectularius]XP_014250137.1 protein fuzzy homolog isoform X2 [Cimex lectularius]XP_014250138.1 protein fuzzy homolog isoform X2 [Cimex lectularius]XP_014250139.1 protein fuzzy homolog isoform X2 [Cimex lectularius]XP_024083037.1 protein fuzzy homolog isoform X2 [Cimex lectularius]